MTDKVSKFTLIKIDEFLIFKWFAMSHDDFDIWDRFSSKKSALKWIRKQQKKQNEHLEKYIVLEDGNIIEDDTEPIVTAKRPT